MKPSELQQAGLPNGGSGSMNLERTEGPECPKCGCCESEVVGRRENWGKEWRRLQCQHCGKTWSAPASDSESNNGKVVVYQVLRCPKCHSGNTVVTSTRKPIRHHKCFDCLSCFSCEVLKGWLHSLSVIRMTCWGQRSCEPAGRLLTARPAGPWEMAQGLTFLALKICSWSPQVHCNPISSGGFHAR